MTERLQPIYDIAALCAKRSVNNAVLCPGSRNAPLTIAFARHPDISARTFSDERSAAFVALGMAQQSGSPTILVCTSGTAAFNFAPAVAEAFFSKTPLLIFTADRPVEWVGQQDGQTIYQSALFGAHVKQSYQLPQDYYHEDSLWSINRIVNEAISLAQLDPPGPVHINAPFREPLYPQPNTEIAFGNARVIEETQYQPVLTNDEKSMLSTLWAAAHNVLVVAGQHAMNPRLLDSLDTFFSHHNVPIVGDILSNVHTINKAIKHADLFLGEARADIRKTLQPDLLITFGGPVISKNLKRFLRDHKPKVHWHIQSAGVVADTFQSITTIIRTNPWTFFDFLSSISSPDNFESQKQNNYNKFWEVEERRTLRSLSDFFPLDKLGEFELVHEIMRHLPDTCSLHLANSMSVRYANSIGLSTSQSDVQVFSNRGTSGIDGCTSTALGHALVNDSPHILITGDLAFFYDRNAFWHNYKIPNLRIVLLNNHGGIIFKMLDGPGNVPEADEYFVTHQALSARKLCEEFSYDYLLLDSRRKLKNLLKDFFDFDGRTKILELESDLTLNKTLFEHLKQTISKHYER